MSVHRKAGKLNPRRFILNCIPSRDTQNDWSAEAAIRAGAVRAAPPPPSKDLRAAWWKVRDQGQSGACVGFATADGVLRLHFVRAGWLRKTDLPAPRFIWMANKETDSYSDFPTTFLEPEGTYLKLALSISRKFGCVLEKDLPMRGGLSKLAAEEFYTKAARLRIASYHNIGADPAQWRSWIANQGPILTRLSVDRAWDRATETKGVLEKYLASTARGGHAVCLVGYTQDGFVVRNSWGTQWGDGGFAYASNAYAAAAFTEAYGAVL